MSTLITPEGRAEASRNFQESIANDPRYELINGQYVLKLEVKINIIEANINFMLSKEGQFVIGKQNYIMNSILNLIKAKSLKIRRDYGI